MSTVEFSFMNILGCERNLNEIQNIHISSFKISIYVFCHFEYRYETARRVYTDTVWSLKLLFRIILAITRETFNIYRDADLNQFCCNVLLD